jgi:hypothetical protein
LPRTGRIIDALEATGESEISLKNIEIAGCSRHGKAALIIGAFDDRIALTLPQKSGTGGTACLRTQTAGQIVGENFNPVRSCQKV